MAKPIRRNPVPAKQPQRVAPKPISLDEFLPYTRWTCYGIIAALTFVLYVNTLWNKYALDDAIVITQNQFTQQGFKGIGKIMTSDVFLGFFKTEKNLVAGGRYRPLSVVTFAIEHEFFGDNPAVSHGVNMLLYALTGIVMFVFLTRLLMVHETRFRNLKYLPLLASLLFIAHPIHTEAVANIKGRDEIMTLLFALLAADSFLKFYDARRMPQLLLGSVWSFLALLSKENAITWLAVIPLSFYFFRTWHWKKALYAVGAAFGVACVYLGMRQAFTATSLNKEVTELMNNPFVAATTAQKFATIVYTWGKYLTLLLFPYKLSHDYYPYQIPLMSFTDWQVLVSVLAYVALVVLALIGLRGKKLYAFCIVYYLATFSVVSNVLFPVGTFMSERFVYMSSLGFCLYAAYLIHLWAVHYSENNTVATPLDYKPALALACLLLLGYSAKTVARNPTWKDNYTLFSTDIRHSPNSAKLNNALGGTSLEFLDKPDVSAADKKRYTEQAEAALHHAIEIYPGFTNAWLLLGNAYVKGDSNFAEGANAYIHCLKINPNYQDAVTNLQVALNKMHDPKAATSVMRDAVQTSPRNPTLWYQYGQALRRNKQFDSATIALEHAVQLNPNYGDAYNQLGLVFGQDLNRIDSSLHYLQRGVQRDPDNVDVTDNLAVALGIKQDFKGAINVLQQGISRHPEHAKFYLTMATTYGALGDQQAATQYMNRAIELDPKVAQQR